MHVDCVHWVFSLYWGSPPCTEEHVVHLWALGNCCFDPTTSFFI